MLRLKVRNPLRLLTSSIVITTPIFLALTAQAAPTVVVFSPGTGSFGAPVFYEAYATSSSCKSGIAAMRIYTAPGVNAYTTNGAHIETFINLKPGRYNTVVQAWDNCGGVAKTNVAIQMRESMYLCRMDRSVMSRITLPHRQLTPSVLLESRRCVCTPGITLLRTRFTQIS
ncbi:MAG: hypothetical protein JWO91_985 [Acidobacteriaceae bacterium]|jgi:hypothetical protein|nr:hypothetical protein [Acidobacteriaceae bacterium]